MTGAEKSFMVNNEQNFIKCFGNKLDTLIGASQLHLVVAEPCWKLSCGCPARSGCVACAVDYVGSLSRIGGIGFWCNRDDDVWCVLVFF